MYIRILDDNEACGSQILFETKDDVVAWLVAEGEDPDVIKAFISYDKLDGQLDASGTYEYIQKIEFNKTIASGPSGTIGAFGEETEKTKNIATKPSEPDSWDDDEW